MRPLTVEEVEEVLEYAAKFFEELARKTYAAGDVQKARNLWELADEYRSVKLNFKGHALLWDHDNWKQTLKNEKDQADATT